MYDGETWCTATRIGCSVDPPLPVGIHPRRLSRSILGSGSRRSSLRPRTVLLLVVLAGVMFQACSDGSSRTQAYLTDEHLLVEMTGGVAPDAAAFSIVNAGAIYCELGIIEIAPDMTWDQLLDLGTDAPLDSDAFELYGRIVTQDAQSVKVPDGIDLGRAGLVIVDTESGAIVPLVSFDDPFPQELLVTVSTRFGFDAFPFAAVCLES